MSRDIKDLLGSAMGDEPPLGIDREAVFEAGRKRLRRRRTIQSGSVVAAVVVIAVGAATLIGVNPDSAPGPSLPPAASETHQENSTTNPDQPGPRSTTTSPTTTTTDRVPDVSGTLTAQLYAVLSPDSVHTEDARLPTFHQKGGNYHFSADVERPTGDGRLTVQVEFGHPRDAVVCSNLPTLKKGCATRVVSGVLVASGEVEYDNGERQLVAIAVLPGRVFVFATASNYPEGQRRQDKRPTGDPVFTEDQLASMVVQAGFSAG